MGDLPFGEVTDRLRHYTGWGGELYLKGVRHYTGCGQVKYRRGSGTMPDNKISEQSSNKSSEHRVS